MIILQPQFYKQNYPFCGLKFLEWLICTIQSRKVFIINKWVKFKQTNEIICFWNFGDYKKIHITTLYEITLVMH